MPPLLGSSDKSVNAAIAVCSDFAPFADVSLLLCATLFTALKAVRKGQTLSFFERMDNAALTIGG
jgi:hypothetical protein